jgi:hypothetical protein
MVGYYDQIAMACVSQSLEKIRADNIRDAD